MIQTVNKWDFIDAFNRADRKEQFSYEALNVLFNWFEQYEEDTGEPVELDVIAICCEWYESDEDELVENYGCPRDDIDTYLNDNTMVAGVTKSGTYVYAAF